MQKKYLLFAVSVIIILSLCCCGTAAQIPSGTEAPSVTVSVKPEPTPALTPTLSPTPTETATPAETATTAPAPSTMWGSKFTGKFTDGEIIKNDNSVLPTISDLSPRFKNCTIEVAGSYKSQHVNITVNKVKDGDNTYFVCDIYVTDLKYFISPFSGGNNYKSGAREFVNEIAQDTNAVLAINGDYYTNNPGPVIRDGVLYRNQVKLDILVMYKDGTMKTLTNEEYDKSGIDAMKDDVWQIWTFGPMLLTDGKSMSEFNLAKKVGGENPRTVVGYYEPGHYVFVIVDGRQPGYSIGYTMADTSQLMYDLGCKEAFNLDGGGTTQMTFLGQWLNKSSVHRKTRDALCIVDEPAS